MPSTLNDSSPHGPLVSTEKSPSEEMTFFNFSFFSPLIYLLTHVLVSLLILWKPEKLSSGRQREETHLYPVLEKRRFVKTVFCASILEVCVRKRDLWRKSLNSNNKSCFELIVLKKQCFSDSCLSETIIFLNLPRTYTTHSCDFISIKIPIILEERRTF